MFLSNAHTHTTYSDGKNTAREMVEAAIAQGLRSLGFSEHLEFRGSSCTLSPEDAPRYRAEIRALREEYAGRIRIWLGAERDAFSDADGAEYEYLIGSAHYIERGGRRITVDGNGDRLRDDVRELFGTDTLAYAQAYYDTLAAYIERQRPAIIGHVDLVRKWNERYHFFDTADPAYRRVVRAALDRMIGTGALLEVNTGAMARGYLTTPYPDPFALEYWHDLGGGVIIGTDCHQAEKLTYGVEEARRLCLDAGYTTAWALGTGETMFEEHAL